MTIGGKQRIWITGASSGIGKAAALELSKRGADIIATARRAEELEKLKAEAAGNDGFIIPAVCDIADAEQVENTYRTHFPDGNISAVINAAGVTSFKKAADNSLQEIKDIIETNLLGAIYIIKSVLPGMIANKEGTIINIESVVVAKVLTNSSVYAASKSGLLAYSKVLREEVRSHKIRVIDIIPGATDTPIWDSSMRKKYGDKMMKPEAIARVIASALFEESNLVTEEIVLRPVTGDL